MSRRISDLEGRDAYDLLGVASTASEQEIRRAYRRAMLTAHPDRGGAEHLAKLINCARELLLTDRASYDVHRRQLAAGRVAEVPGGGAGSGAGGGAGSREGDRAGGGGGGGPGARESDWAAWEAETRNAENRAPGDPWVATDGGATDEGRPGPPPRPPWQPPPPPPPAPPPQRRWEDAPPDDRPFASRGRPELPWSDRLMNVPMMLGALLVIGVLVGVIAAVPGSPDSSPSSLSSPASPAPALSSAAAGPGPRFAPLSVPGSADHVCGVSKLQTLWCSGANSEGQLGVGDRDDHAGPVTPLSSDRWRQVTTGQRHTCGITVSRDLFCWGENGSGQLGTANRHGVTAPVRIGRREWFSVASYRNLTCGVSTDHRLFCWGSTLLRGRGQPVSSLSPRPVGAGATWAAVKVSGTQVCAARPGRVPTCFGT